MSIFIGELYILRILTQGIILYCVDQLFKNQSKHDAMETISEEKLEAAINLLNLIGRLLDKHAIGSSRMSKYYIRLESFVSPVEKNNNNGYSLANKYSTRIRFLIQDLLELKKVYK